MSNFDVAVGINSTPLDQGAEKLYDDPTVRDKLFRGTTTKNIDPIGEVALSWDVLAAPTFTLSAPTQNQWDAATKASQEDALPTGNVFQVHFPEVEVTVTIAGAEVATKGAMDAYATVVDDDGGNVKFELEALFIDDSDFSIFDQAIIIGILVPEGIKLANSFLQTYQLPSIPPVEGVTFNPINIDIVQNLLIFSATSTANLNPFDISDFAWPSTEDYFGLLSPTILNTVIDTTLKAFENETEEGKAEKGNLAFKAKADFKATLKSISGSVLPNDNTKIKLQVTADASAHAGISGIVPTVLCPVGTALNAL